MSKKYRTNRLHKWAWIIFHLIKWRKTKAVRNAVGDAIDRIERQL